MNVPGGTNIFYINPKKTLPMIETILFTTLFTVTSSCPVSNCEFFMTNTVAEDVITFSRAEVSFSVDLAAGGIKVTKSAVLLTPVDYRIQC